MKKKLLILCSIILLIIGCSNTETQQEEEIKIVKSSVTMENIQVAGASYNPNVQNGEELEEVIAVPKDPMNYSKDPIKEVVPTTGKKSYTPKESKSEVAPISEKEVDMAIVETLDKKIKEDEKISKGSMEKEILISEASKPIEEEHKKKSPTLWIILGAIALGAGAILFKKK